MKISSKMKDYTLEMTDDILKRRDEHFHGMKHDRLFFLMDENFGKLYADGLSEFTRDDHVLTIRASENNKSYIKLADYYRALIENQITRNDILVTFGGGILQDISGFIASTLYRGLRWVFFPTTLLAQADSCIGSKTSINFEGSKNLIGNFYPPDRIFVDISFAATLTDEYFNSGLGEIIKFHLMSDEEGYSRLKQFLSAKNLRTTLLLKDIVLSTLTIKKSYFEEDEFDTGRRNLLNYGHCFGHALESATDFRISHGEAVTVGMGVANLLSLKRGIMSEKKYLEFEEIFRRHYPRFAIGEVPVEALISYMKKDKKRVGKDLTMILSEDVGKQYKLDDVLESEIREVYSEFSRNYPDQ
jgi:3-dehydroquinate synthase